MTARVPGIEAAEPPLLAGLAISMVIASAAVTWLPAHRATTINPVETLRRDA